MIDVVFVAAFCAAYLSIAMNDFFGKQRTSAIDGIGAAVLFAMLTAGVFYFIQQAAS